MTLSSLVVSYLSVLHLLKSCLNQSTWEFTQCAVTARFSVWHFRKCHMLGSPGVVKMLIFIGRAQSSSVVKSLFPPDLSNPRNISSCHSW